MTFVDRDRLPQKTSPQIVDLIPQWESQLRSPDFEYALSAKCGRCGTLIPLNQEVPVEWQVEGTASVYLGKYPGYPCNPCSVNNFKPTTLALLKFFAQLAAENLEIPLASLQQPPNIIPIQNHFPNFSET